MSALLRQVHGFSCEERSAADGDLWTSVWLENERMEAAEKQQIARASEENAAESVGFVTCTLLVSVLL